MSDKLLNEDMDAQRWAREFLAVINGGAVMDKSLMIAWFANAIMCGHDNARWEAERKALPEAVPAWTWSLDQPEVSGWRWIETWDENAMCFDVLRFHVGDKLKPNVAAWRYVDPPSSRLPQKGKS